MRVKNHRQRSRLLFLCAEERKTYAQVCDELQTGHFQLISEAEWKLWVDYYFPLVKSNPLYKEELINNNRTLSWFARNLSERYNKTSLS